MDRREGSMSTKVNKTDAEWRAQLTPEQYAIVYRHGTFEAGLYAPRGVDDQTPHTRDEAYVVVKGSGWFVCGNERRAFSPGELLFVPAGMTHRFESITKDLTVWVIFYGPQGGEHVDEGE
jgi:mannose-6-phosphate isomerase-like protein (cupin superfamily)